MDIITYALNRVKRSIPPKVLKLAFTGEATYFQIQTSMDKQIEDLVIKQHVLVDCNLINGMSTQVSLGKCKRDTYVDLDETESTIITIPPNLISNKKVIAINSITQGYSNQLESYDRGNIIDVVGRMLPNTATEPILITNVRLLSNNVLLVNEPIDIFLDGLIDVELENDANMGNMPKQTHIAFSKLVVLAVKAYIYNELSIDIEEGSLYFGHEVSGYSNAVSKYEGSQEEYDTYLDEEWPKISFSSDVNKMEDFISGLVGSPI